MVFNIIESSESNETIDRPQIIFTRHLLFLSDFFLKERFEKQRHQTEHRTNNNISRERRQQQSTR